MRLEGMKGAQRATWAEEVFGALQDVAIRQAAYVPDAGHARLIELCHADAHIKAIPLTTEEEGIPLLAGGWLGGDRGVLLMQSSGVGNCINMLAMVKECSFPLLMLVTMRGESGEFNPWQVPMGQAARPLLQQLGVGVQHVDVAERLAETVEAAARLAFDSNQASAVLVSQRIVGFKEWNQDGQ